MKSAQKWEQDHQMRIHKNRIKNARKTHQSCINHKKPLTSDSTGLKNLLKEYELQQHYIVIFI